MGYTGINTGKQSVHVYSRVIWAIRRAQSREGALNNAYQVVNNQVKRHLQIFDTLSDNIYESSIWLKLKLNEIKLKNIYIKNYAIIVLYLEKDNFI